MYPNLDLVQAIIRILLAIVIGGVLGLERESKHRPAGFRTYVIVCLGSTLIALTNVYLFKEGLSADAARIPAQVISGIGFLGAGTILVTRANSVKGLTTAAGLWTTAAIGLALGTGFYSAAIISSILLIISMHLLQYVDLLFTKKKINANVYAELQNASAMQIIFKHAKANNYKIDSLEFFNSSNTCVVTFQLKGTSKIKSLEDITEELLGNDAINFIETY